MTHRKEHLTLTPPAVEATQERFLPGIGVERTLLPSVSPEMPVDEEEEVEGRDFHSKLAALGDLSDRFRYPTMDPRVMAGRERLQNRRNFLRSLYKLPAKDIVWPEGKSTTDLVNQWKAEKKQIAMYAYTETMPRNEGEVLDLINAIGAGTDTAKDLIKIHKDFRPDLAYAKLSEELDAAMAANDSRTAAQIVVRDSIVDNVFNKDKFKELVAKAGGIGALGKEFEDYATSAINLLTTEPPDEKLFTIPWAMEDTETNRKLLAQAGAHYTPKTDGGPIRLEGKPWLLIGTDRASTVKSFNMNDSKDRDLVNTFSAMNVPGFGAYSPSTPASYLTFTDPGGRVFGQPFDSANMALQDYASHLARQGVQTKTIETARAMQEQFGEAKKSPTYARAVRDKRQATTVITMAQSLLNAITNVRAKAAELGKPEPKLVGGIAGLQFTFDNFMELGNDLFGALGWTGDPSSPADYSLDMAVNGLHVLREQVNELRPTASVSSPKEFKALQDDLSQFERYVKDLSGEISSKREEGTFDDMVWQGRVSAKLLSTAMATLVARLYSSTDRLLKLQYMDFRNQLDLHSPWMSERLGIARLSYLVTLGNFSLRQAEDIINQVQPSGWTRTEEGLYVGPSETRQQAPEPKPQVTGPTPEELKRARETSDRELQ